MEAPGNVEPKPTKATTQPAARDWQTLKENDLPGLRRMGAGASESFCFRVQLGRQHGSTCFCLSIYGINTGRIYIYIYVDVDIDTDIDVDVDVDIDTEVDIDLD